MKSEFTTITLPASLDASSSSRNRANTQNYDIEKEYGKTEPSKTVNQVPFVVLGKDFSDVSNALKFFICSTGVFIFFLIYGYMQELIFSLPGFKPFGWYLTLVQFACYSISGSIEIIISKGAFKRRIPMKTYALLAFLTVATMGLSNTSVGYLNYPTQVIFKCCKLIPVMIGGILIQGKQYSRLDFIACLCMSVGLIFFTLADSEVSPNFNPTGLVLISLALCADAVIGNVQEKAMVMHGATNTEVVLYSYAIGFFYILFGLLVSGGLFDAFNFCLKHPIKTYGYAVIFSLSGYFGISYVLTLVRLFGALIAVTVTTCRKAVTIIISFVFFTKPFTFTYMWAGLIVLFGIALNIYQKNKTKVNLICLQIFSETLIKMQHILSPPKKKVLEV